MHTSLIITTYNRPNVLALILRSVAGQSELPDEVVVADDGSTPETRARVEELRPAFPVPLEHVWQQDKGFRVASVRNLGAAEATGELLIFIDGDMILHKDFVKSHKANARRGRFLHGPRVLVSERMTKRILTEKKLPRIHFFNTPMSHRFNTIQSRFLSRLFTRETDKAKSRACNLSVFKDDYVAVNGFNEDFIGWGEEDSEFTWRLMQHGLKKVNLRYCAVQYHLDHGNHNEVANREHLDRNIALFAAVREEGDSRCRNGYDRHVRKPAHAELIPVANR